MFIYGHNGKDWNIGASGKISYVNSLLDLMDFRKYKVISHNVMTNFCITEVYIKVGDQINQHIIKINKFALNGIFNCIITISDTLKY